MDSRHLPAPLENEETRCYCAYLLLLGTSLAPSLSPTDVAEAAARDLPWRRTRSGRRQRCGASWPSVGAALGESVGEAVGDAVRPAVGEALGE